MSRTAPIKRPATEDLLYHEKKRQRVLSEIETRVEELRKIILSKGRACSELGQALFTWIASNPADEGMWQGVFSALGLSTETLNFQKGDSIDLPLCLWNVHGTYFQTLFNKKMKETPLEDDTEDVMLEAFKTCLKTCSASVLDQTNWQGLFTLAQKYQVSWLINACEDFLCKNKNLFQFTETDQQMLLCFAAHYSLSKLLRTCLHHFIRYDVKVTTDLDLLKEIQASAHQYSLADLKLYASSLLNDFLWIDPLTDELCLELDSDDVEMNVNEIRECISGESLWHSPQIRLNINDQNAAQTETLNFLLIGNRTLTGLSLSVCPAVIQIIMEMMRENHSLQHLALYGTFEADKEFAFFLNFLKEHAALKTLKLWNCQLGAESAVALQAFLSFNPHLESFTIGDQFLDKEMILALQKGCASNTHLIEFAMEECDICGEGSLVDFLASLETHPTLKKLKLGQPFNVDDLEEDPIASLLKMLKINKTLETLTLENLDEEAVQDFLTSCLESRECGLKEIVFKICDLSGKETIQNIFEALKIRPIKLVFQKAILDQEAQDQILIEQQNNPTIYIHFE